MNDDDVKERAKALIADLEEALNVSDIAAVDWGEQIEIEIGTVERHLREAIDAATDGMLDAYEAAGRIQRERDEAIKLLDDVTLTPWHGCTCDHMMAEAWPCTSCAVTEYLARVKG